MYESKAIMKVAFLASALATLALAPMAVPSARAYGNTAIWQLGVSFNCNDKIECLVPPFGIGGFWGWIEFDSGNSGQATLTGCSHLSTSLGVLTGADHLQVEITSWTTATHSMGPPVTFVLTDGTITITGVNTKGAPVTLTFAQSGFAGDTMIPAIPGHFSSQSIFGFHAPPGMNFEIQVVKIPNR